MTTQTRRYTVTTIHSQGDEPITSRDVGIYPSMDKAMKAAKRAAGTRDDCQKYGPTSLCYVGETVTAVVAW